MIKQLVLVAAVLLLMTGTAAAYSYGPSGYGTHSRLGDIGPRLVTSHEQITEIVSLMGITHPGLRSIGPSFGFGRAVLYYRHLPNIGPKEPSVRLQCTWR